MAGTAVPISVFANNPNTTVVANGYNGGSATGDAPAALTTETWTMTSSASFSLANSSATPPTYFAVADAAAPSEIIWVTNMTGAGDNTWSVTRGEEGTTPVTHAAGATFYQVVTAAFLAMIAGGAGNFYGNQSSPGQPLYGAWLYGSAGSLDQYSADGNIYNVGQQFIQTTSPTSGSTGTASQNITGLVASLGLGSYYLDVNIAWEPTVAGSTTKFGFSAGGGLTLSAISMGSLIGGMGTSAEAGTSVLVTSTTLSDAMWTSPTRAGTSGYGYCHLWGTLTVATAGTLQAVFSNGTSADTATMAAGASILVRPNN